MHYLTLAVVAMLGTAHARSQPSRIQKRDPSATVNAPLATSVNNNDGAGNAVSSNYVNYSGDGSDWPAISQWVNFDDMFNANKNSMFNSCENDGVANDSGEEVGDIYNGIRSVAQDSGVDHRFILAIIMNESHGCVRAPTTIAPGDGPPIYNPGLMQDFDGYYTCNTQNGDQYGRAPAVTNPCPQDTITQMIREGTQGTDNGDGLATLINDAASQGASGAQAFYVAAIWYNRGEGTPPVGGDLTQNGNNYARDVANRLTGWTN